MKLLVIFICCCLLFACASQKTVIKQEEQNGAPTVVQSDTVKDKESQREKLREFLTLNDPGPLSREEYRLLTRHPYSREPFRADMVANQKYFNGFREGFSIRTRQPGQLVFRGKFSGSLADAAENAGFSAGITGDVSQLTDAERQEVEDWKQKYKEVQFWPYVSNVESEYQIKLKAAMEELKKENGR